jgi:hypothetical protein
MHHLGAIAVCDTIAAIAAVPEEDFVPTAVSEPPDSSMAYRNRIDDVAAALGTDVRLGLTDDEARSFNVVNARSDEHSAFVHLFTNRWLWSAMAGSVPCRCWRDTDRFVSALLDRELDTRDWTLCCGHQSVLSLREGSKLVARRF